MLENKQKVKAASSESLTQGAPRLARVVIVGAGFGGLQAAKGLKDAPVEITLIDRRNHHLFQPLLYQVATAGLTAADIAVPIRGIFRRQKNIEIMMSEVTGVDLNRRQVHFARGSLEYDYLILATGAQYNYFGNDSWRKFAPSLKSLEDAREIRAQLLLAFEAAEIEPDPVRQKELLTFVLVGGGPTGVELAGSIAELALHVLAKDFKHIRPQSARILLLEGGPRILSSFPDRLSDDAKKDLEDLGVEVRTRAQVTQMNRGVVLVGNESIKAGMVIWTAGVKAGPIGSWLNSPMDKVGRVKVNSDLSLVNDPSVFVIGDAACVLGENGKPLPGVAPVAMQQGKYVASVIHKRLEGEPNLTPFEYKDKGNLATIGRHAAIADLGAWKFDGMLAWLTWAFIHIFYLINFKNRVFVLLEWAYSYFTYQRGARLITGQNSQMEIYQKDWMGKGREEQEEKKKAQEVA